MRSSMKHALYQDFFPHMLILLHKCISNHETKQASKFQSDPSSNCFTIDVWIIFLLSYCFFLYLILRKFCSDLTCDILGIGLLYVQYVFKKSVQVWKWKKWHNIPLSIVRKHHLSGRLACLVYLWSEKFSVWDSADALFVTVYSTYSKWAQ